MGFMDDVKGFFIKCFHFYQSPEVQTAVHLAETGLKVAGTITGQPEVIAAGAALTVADTAIENIGNAQDGEDTVKAVDDAVKGGIDVAAGLGKAPHADAAKETVDHVATITTHIVNQAQVAPGQPVVIPAEDVAKLVGLLMTHGTTIYSAGAGAPSSSGA